MAHRWEHGGVDTAEIEVFLALADELHFGRTAERLRIPQPRVSRLVSALERRVGGALFERTSRRVRLTPLGEQLRDQLQPTYKDLTAALDGARATPSRGQGSTPHPGRRGSRGSQPRKRRSDG